MLSDQIYLDRELYSDERKEGYFCNHISQYIAIKKSKSLPANRNYKDVDFHCLFSCQIVVGFLTSPLFFTELLLAIL